MFTVSDRAFSCYCLWACVQYIQGVGIHKYVQQYPRTGNNVSVLARDVKPRIKQPLHDMYKWYQRTTKCATTLQKDLLVRVVRCLVHSINNIDVNDSFPLSSCISTRQKSSKQANEFGNKHSKREDSWEANTLSASSSHRTSFKKMGSTRDRAVNVQGYQHTWKIGNEKVTYATHNQKRSVDDQKRNTHTHTHMCGKEFNFHQCKFVRRN